MGPRHKAGAVPRNERGGVGRVALTMGKEFGVRLLIGYISVVSDWCSHGLCGTAG